MTEPRVPILDDELRRRLGRRFGPSVESWFDELPAVLVALAEAWQIDFESLIPRGTMSVVIRCRTPHGRAVLKVSPDRRRVQDEAAALTGWTTGHVPTVLAVDEAHGALLIEAIQPGTPLVESATYPSIDRLGRLLTALHASGSPDGPYITVAERVTYLYRAGLKNYERRADLETVISPELYRQGHESAMRLAQDSPSRVLLHGDLTPANILDGGRQRGLVAIDPAPCFGDPAFDAIDLVLWQADTAAVVTERADQLAPNIGTTGRRLAQWCYAFAAMTALELAEASQAVPARTAMLVELARRAN